MARKEKSRCSTWRKLLQKVHFNWFAKECLYRNARQGCVGVRTCYMIRLWSQGRRKRRETFAKHRAFNREQCGCRVKLSPDVASDFEENYFIGSIWRWSDHNLKRPNCRTNPKCHFFASLCFPIWRCNKSCTAVIRKISQRCSLGIPSSRLLFFPFASIKIFMLWLAGEQDGYREYAESSIRSQILLICHFLTSSFSLLFARVDARRFAIGPGWNKCLKPHRNWG